MNVYDYIFIGLTVAGVLMSFLRIIIGPTTADKLTALDSMNVMLVGVIVFMSFLLKNGLYLDIALVYALLSFVETIVISRYMERKGND